MSGLPAWLMPHEVEVETYRGDSAHGDSYKPAATVRCAIDDQRQLVRGPRGDEVVSETTLRTSLEDAPRFTLDSRVTVNGRRTFVLGTSRRELGELSEADHLEVSLR
jgi:hypothetical protein